MSRREPKPLVRANVLDRAVGWLSPERGAMRLKARAAMEYMTAPVSGVRRSGASTKDRMSDWIVSRLSRWEEGRERDMVSDRAEDLAANNGLASSAVLSLCLNVIGSGVRPQAWPDASRLGLSEEAAEAFAESAEWAFEIWSKNAGPGGVSFYDQQFQGAWSFFSLGEFVQIPLMRRKPGSPFALALQTIHPSRLRTPTDMLSDPQLRDGVELGEEGEPVAYWVADPPDGYQLGGLASDCFRRFERSVAHRRGFFHAFHLKRPEQLRGESILGPGMVSLRYLGDFDDYSLIHHITQSAVPVFIETEDPLAAWMRQGRGLDGQPLELSSDGQRYEELPPGSVGYGRPGEKPHLLAPQVPGPDFVAFAKRFARIVAASTGQPYEAVMRDFSESNYSNTRAALLEAWKLYKLYHAVMVRQHFQIIYEHVLEEAWHLGLLRVPKGAPGFYEAKDFWCAAAWNPPARGYVDPVKERDAVVIGLDNNIDTLSDACAEQGRDYREVLRQRARERRMAERLGVPASDSASQAVRIRQEAEDKAAGEHLRREEEGLQ